MKSFPHRRWWALAALALAVLTLGFDITILNVALPTIATDLSASTSALQWMVNAYVLVMAGLMLTCGALGDRYGRKRLIVVALGVFGLASAAAAWAPTAGWVIGARAVMGVGAAILVPVAFAVVAVLFVPQQRGKAVAALVMATGIGIPLGPLIAGYLLEHFWWGSVFLINVPLVLAALAAIAVLLPESRDPDPRRLDVVGAFSSTAGLSILGYAVISAPTRGWTDPVVAGCLLTAAALLTGFAGWELRTGQPMIDLHLFGQRQFLWASVAGMLVSFGLLGILFVIPQYLQLVAGHDAFGTGLRLLPLIAGLVIGAPAGERLAARRSYRAPVAAGLAVLATGVALGAATTTTSEYGFVAGWLCLAGLGTGMALAPAMDAVLDALPTEHAGAGTAVTMTLRQVGGALGVAVLGSVLAQGYTTRLDTSSLPAAAAETARDSLAGAARVATRLNLPDVALSAQTAYLHGMALVLVVTAVLALLGAGIAFARLPGRPPTAGAPTPADGLNDASRNIAEGGKMPRPRGTD